MILEPISTRGSRAETRRSPNAALACETHIEKGSRCTRRTRLTFVPFAPNPYNRPKRYGMLELIAIYLVLGAAVGVVAGLLGVGGGLIIVPVLTWLFTEHEITDRYAVHLAIGTSLATILLTSISSVYAHHRRGAVRWDIIRRLVPGIAAGALLGAVIARGLSQDGLSNLFGLFELLVALHMLLDVKVAAHRQLPGPRALFGAGGVIGTVSSLLGIGGGTLTVPFLVWCNTDMRHAIATASAGGLPIAIAGTLGFIAVGWNLDGLPQGSTGYVYWPAFAGVVTASILTAPVGASLAHRLPVKTLKRIFAVFLLALGTKMLLG